MIRRCCARAWSFQLRLTLVASALWASSALAQPAVLPTPLQVPFESANEGNSDFPFSYHGSVPNTTLRYVLEELGVLLAGTGYYFAQKDVNSVDWEFGYSWSTLRAKLEGQAYAFDNNFFTTNYVSHPGAGALYYTAARANRFGVWTAFGSAVAGSTLWEVLGEFRERVSVNDMVITPVAGSVFGESLFQLGAFFDRACDTATNRVLGSIFGFAKSLHDHIDGVALKRALQCDRFGFPRPKQHHFDVGLSALAIAPQAARSTVVGTRATLNAHLAHLPPSVGQGSRFRVFGDGNLTTMSMDARLTGNTDSSFRLSARSLPFGVYVADVHRAPNRPRFDTEWIAALGAGVDYTLQSLQTSTSRARRDAFFVLEAPACWLGWRRWFGRSQLRLELLVASVLGGVTSLAKVDYLKDHPATDLTTVAEAHDYNHVLGIALAPRMQWVARDWSWALQARADRVVGIRVLDANGQRHSDVETAERRRVVSTQVLVGKPLTPQWQTEIELMQRAGNIGSTERALSALSVSTGLLYGF